MDHIKALCEKFGKGANKTLILGNVTFWIDADGPWAGQLSYDLPTSQWNAEDIKSVINKLFPR